MEETIVITRCKIMATHPLKHLSHQLSKQKQKKHKQKSKHTY